MTGKRIWRDELFKVMQIYQRELSDFIYRPMSPAMIYRMEDRINQVRHRYRQLDRNPIWDIEVKIVVQGPGTFELQPVLDDVILEDKPEIPF